MKSLLFLAIVMVPAPAVAKYDPGCESGRPLAVPADQVKVEKEEVYDGFYTVTVDAPQDFEGLQLRKPEVHIFDKDNRKKYVFRTYLGSIERDGRVEVGFEFAKSVGDVTVTLTYGRSCDYSFTATVSGS